MEFVDRCYGKNYVRVLHVRREGDLHHVKEIKVNTALTLSDTRDYLQGDNSQIVATDSQKNTVYILARRHGITSLETFATLLTSHFLHTYSHVTHAQVRCVQKNWTRIQQDGKEHKHAFVAQGAATRSCHVTQDRHGPAQVSSRLADMEVLKTTQSAFKGFVSDEYRVLPDAEDRLFSTIIDANWRYKAGTTPCYCEAWTTVKESLLEAFAGEPDKGVYSPSVQQTLYEAAKLIFDAVPQIEEVTIEMPNVHAFQFDFTRFKDIDLQNQGRVFQPVSEPSGNIKATLRRSDKAKL